MKQLLLFTLCLAWLGLAAQPDTIEIKKLKYNNVKFYMGQKRVLKDILMYDAWSLGRLDISPVVADSLADFLLLRKNIVIELGGHSNCVEMQEPKESSLNAANYVKNYLVGKGVPADRVQTYGYGRNQPLVACPDSGSAHSSTFVNRRIEAKIVDIVKPKLTFADSVLYSGQVMVLHSLGNYIEGGKLTSGGKAIGDSLLAFLQKHPQLKVEIGVHTDTQGDANKNLDNSKTFADIFKYYLINNKLDGTRFTATGYGESMPMVPCPTNAECGEDVNSKNRRVEVKILSIE